MLELPIIVFSVDIPEYKFELNIVEVFGYPETTCVDGGYDVVGFLNMQIGCFAIS